MSSKNCCVNYSVFYFEIYKSHAWDRISRKLQEYCLKYPNDKKIYSPKYKAILRGLMAGNSPRQISDELKINYNSLRVLLKDFYLILEDIFGKKFNFDQDKYIQVRDWAEKYKNKSQIKLIEIIESQPKLSSFSIDEIIDLFCHRLEQSQNSTHQITNEIKVQRLNKYLVQADDSDRRGFYDMALNAYKNLLEQGILDYLGVAVKIVCVLEKKGSSLDAFKLSSFVLRHIEKPEHKVILHNIIAGIYHDTALANEDEGIGAQALNYYQLAFECSNNLDILPAWNIIELLIELGIKTKKSFYLSEAILRWKNFPNLVINEHSNARLYWEGMTRRSVEQVTNKIKSKIKELEQNKQQKTLLYNQLNCLLKEIILFVSETINREKKV